MSDVKVGQTVEFVMPKMLASEPDWWAGRGIVKEVRPDGIIVIALAGDRTTARNPDSVRVVTSHPADCPCERQGPLFRLAQRMEEVILARRDGHWSNDWEIAQAHVLDDYDTWRSA